MNVVRFYFILLNRRRCLGDIIDGRLAVGELTTA